MTERNQMTRRRFLVLSGGAVAVAAGAGAVTIAGGGDDQPDAQYELSRHAAAAFEDPDAARAVGRAYRDSNPKESDERRIVEALTRSNREWGSAGPDDVLRLGGSETKRDFAKGRVVAVDGWYLARTEARLCALASFA